MGWKPFKAIVRAFTPNPQSFTPANIARVVSAATVGVYTGGLAAFNPSVGNTVIASTNPEKAAVVNAAYTGASTFGQATVTKDPESLVNKVARLFGGAVSSIAVGSAATNILTTTAATSSTALPAGVQGPTQGLTVGEKFGNFGATFINTSATAYGTGSFARAVVNVFGQKVGGAILQLLSGDVGGFVKTITTPTPTSVTPTPPNLFASYGGGGGGGLGIGTGSNTGQFNTNSLLFPLMGIAVVLAVWLIVRKK